MSLRGAAPEHSVFGRRGNIFDYEEIASPPPSAGFAMTLWCFANIVLLQTFLVRGQ